MADLTGQVALVTGGVRGIGHAIVKRLAERGVTVAAGYSRDTASAEKLQKELGDTGLSLHRGNVANADDCVRVVNEVLEQHGQLDILVNNAGITIDKSMRKMTADDWDRVIQTNLSSAFYMSKAVEEHMLGRTYGRIVNISSITGMHGAFGQANYAAAKAGMFGLTKTMALETARKGITVNCVAPGYTATEMVQAMPQEVLDGIVAKIPLHRMGSTEEVARVVEFLAHPDSGYITGQVFIVDGGVTM